MTTVAALDLGASSLKAAVLGPDDDVVTLLQHPIRGQLDESLLALLQHVADDGHGASRLVAVTGTHAPRYAQTLGVPEINEVVATYTGARKLAPNAGAILALGAEHARFLRFGPPRPNGSRELRGAAQNSACSAGTGTFLEQEAHRFGMSVPDFAEQATRTRRSLPVAGRCAVFAKTDIVHKHQTGVPVADLAYALCRAVAQNAVSELIAGRRFETPVAVVGGLARNGGVTRALREILGLPEADVTIPAHGEFIEAVGAALTRGTPVPRGTVRESLVRLRTGDRGLPPAAQLPPLAPRRHAQAYHATGTEENPQLPHGLQALGIDIGSTSTNIALISDTGHVIDHHSTATRGEPLQAVVTCLDVIRQRRASPPLTAVAVTGSGRRLVQAMIGADLAINEITAHAEGGTLVVPEVTSIVDIGGQDSKFIRIENGAVVDFEMNKICAAGTGSFLEEMSEVLGVHIAGEFSAAALRATCPTALGQRCTVFMASEVVRRQQEGAQRDDLAAGLSHAVVSNYLARVVGRRPMGDRIVFQGGVANNEAVVAALEGAVGQPVIVHPYNDVAGAVGAARFAQRQGLGHSRFRWDTRVEPSMIRTRSVECHRCSNQCTVHVTRREGGARFYSGGLCGRFEGLGGVAPDRSEPPLPDLFTERVALLEASLQPADPPSPGAIGIPRALVFQETLPFWTTFFNTLGVGYVVSEPTTRVTVERGASVARGRACLPLKVAYGHCAELLDQGVARLFVPSVASLDHGTASERLDHLCPTVQAWPYTFRALVPSADIIAPRLRMSLAHLRIRDMRRLGRTLGFSRRKTMNALDAAEDAQHRFLHALSRRGSEILAAPDPDHLRAVILARSYLAGDQQVHLRLRRVLETLGILAIPMDMIPGEPRTSDELHGMYWYFGKRLTQTAAAIRERSDLTAIVVSTFGCGPDSFIQHMLRHQLADVPLLELDVDEHSEFTGVHTRLEAFRYSAARCRNRSVPTSPTRKRASTDHVPRRRELLIPQMGDHAFALAAAFRSCGVPARVLPLPDRESIDLGCRALDGTECLPCAFVAGDMLRHLAHTDGEDADPAFFMVSGDGPCRLGQYTWLHRTILDELGFAHVPIFDASQDPRFYERFGDLPARFRRHAWRGILAADLLFRKWRETRTRAVDRDLADATYRSGRAALAESLERGHHPKHALAAAVDRLGRVPQRSTPPRVTVGVLGENYVRCNAVANGRIAELLEDLGAEVWFPSLAEWVDYTNWTARLHCRYERNPRQTVKLMLVDAVQHLDAALMDRAVRGRLGNIERPGLRWLFRHTAPYVPNTLEGETIVGLGRTLDLHARGADGVIHVAPFGCMVGRTVETLCERLSEDLDGFPITSVELDGQHAELTLSRLEGFLLRADAWKEGHGNASSRRR